MSVNVDIIVLIYILSAVVSTQSNISSLVSLGDNISLHISIRLK